MKLSTFSVLLACLAGSAAQAATQIKAPAHRAAQVSPGKGAARLAPRSVQKAGRERMRLDVVASAYSWREPSQRRWGRENALGGRLDAPLEGLDHVAVDPSVIPLGSIIEIPGAGRRIASDTGGRIRGQRIDVHWQSTVAVRYWAKRSVTVTVLRWGWG